MILMRSWALGVLAWCAATSVAHADSVLQPVYVRSPFWEAARNPDAPRIDALLRQGRARLQPALGLGLLLGTDAFAHRRAGIENALARFERALTIDPQHAEALYLSGRALALWERRTPQGQVERRTQEAIARFEALSRVAPLYEAEDVAFELGVLYTREGDFVGASEAYKRALLLRVDGGSRSVLLGNLAEVMMMREDLDESVRLYEQAVAEGSREERVLSLWGLAVALDRLGEKGESMERARQAIRDDQRPMGALKQNSVFFVPAYESHYYDGLGLLALAEVEAAEQGKAEHIVNEFGRAVEAAASSSALLALKQVLASLEDEGHRELAEPLYAAVERALRKVPKQPKAQKTKQNEDSAEARALKVVLLSVQSLRAFARYLDRGGDQGPWANDARVHLTELSRWFTPSRRNKPKAPR
jgi:tetratricopeptide (TPR) repeat protein